MKKLALLMIVFVMSLSSFAQEISKEEWRKMSREERKAYKQKVLLENHQKTMEVLTSRAWVLEAHQIQDRYGESAMIEPNLNFVGVAGEHSSVQLGSSGDIGWNGVGGITVDGNVRKYELKEGKKPGSGAHVRISVMGAAAGHIDMSILISADGNATATLSDNTGDKLIYRGKIVPLAESIVYKGQTLF